MEDIKIYDIALEVLSGITEDLKESIYDPLKGVLALTWSREPNFNAYAKSKSDINSPPDHLICIHYELVRQLYRDVESFCDFYFNHLTKSEWEAFFEGLDDAPPLTQYFTQEECTYNMFVGALTFIYFHELGHLLQQHWYIRQKFGESAETIINECQMASKSTLKGDAASVSHVTELCADFYATTKCLYELMRHFQDNKEELRGVLFIFVCGLSCIFHKFSGSVPYTPNEAPIGTHPNPSIRMEFNLPHIYELMDLIAVPSGHSMSRRDLVHLCRRASDSSSLYYMAQNRVDWEYNDYLSIRGILNRPEDNSYLKHIVCKWDEIGTLLKRITIGGHKFDFLSFTQEFRDQIDRN